MGHVARRRSHDHCRVCAFLVAFCFIRGGGQTFIDLSMRIGGRSQGGAAKIATVASSLFAMVSGSAVANVATTGNFTIPMMKRLKYPPAFAGGVEAVASTGGQIAPPILGAAAFIMAEILGVSYVTIALAAVLPALLFYVAVFFTLHLVAVRKALPLVPESELPAWPDVLQLRRLTPIVAALGGLFGGVLNGYSIQFAAFFRHYTAAGQLSFLCVARPNTAPSNSPFACDRLGRCG